MRLSARHGLMLATVLAAGGCLRIGYDALATDSGGGSGSGGTSTGATAGIVGEAGDGPIAGGSGGTTGGNGGTGGSTAGGTTSGGTGGVQPPLPGPPTAAFTLSPPAGDTASTFSAAAGASSDAEDAFDALVFEWDWESDGTYDDSGATATHTFAAAGDYTVTLRVTDTDGNSALATRTVAVVAAGDLLLVSTADDEDDDGATLADPLGAGLSLREAMTIANATVGPQVITFQPGLTIAMGFALPAITDATDIYGNGTVIDGTLQGGSGACFRFRSTVRAYDLEIHSCGGPPITVQDGTDCVVSGCYLHDNGIALYSLTSTNGLFINNEIAFSADGGLYSNSPGDQVIGNYIHDNATETILTGGGAVGIVVRGNLLVGGTESIAMAGDNAIIQHNTMVGASLSGVRPVNAGGIDLRNNIFVNTGLAISGNDADFAAQDYNLFFDNAGGLCSPCTPGANLVEADPLFVDPAAGDYRLDTNSPAINAGVDVGLPFAGSAPDLGYYEAP